MKRIVLFFALLYLICIFEIIYTLIFNTSNEPTVAIKYFFGNVLYIIISISFFIGPICIICITISNITNAMELFLYDDLELEKIVELVKTAIIPYLVLNFIQIILSRSRIVREVSSGFFSDYDFIIYFIIMLVTSSYSILYIILLQEKNVITKNQLRLHIIMQMIIVIDIIDIFYLREKYKIYKMSNVA
jgi:hypothetical protein